jgi:hypothetical protein
MKARFILFLLVALFSLELHAQFGPENGVKASEPKFVLLQHATIMVKPGLTLADCDCTSTNPLASTNNLPDPPVLMATVSAAEE